MYVRIEKNLTLPSSYNPVNQSSDLDFNQYPQRMNMEDYFYQMRLLLDYYQTDRKQKYYLIRDLFKVHGTTNYKNWYKATATFD